MIAIPDTDKLYCQLFKYNILYIKYLEMFYGICKTSLLFTHMYSVKFYLQLFSKVHNIIKELLIMPRKVLTCQCWLNSIKHIQSPQTLSTDVSVTILETSYCNDTIVTWNFNWITAYVRKFLEKCFKFLVNDTYCVLEHENQLNFRILERRYSTTFFQNFT